MWSFMDNVIMYLRFLGRIMNACFDSDRRGLVMYPVLSWFPSYGRVNLFAKKGFCI